MVSTRDQSSGWFDPEAVRTNYRSNESLFLHLAFSSLQNCLGKQGMEMMKLVTPG